MTSERPSHSLHSHSFFSFVGSLSAGFVSTGFVKKDNIAVNQSDIIFTGFFI